MATLITIVHHLEEKRKKNSSAVYFFPVLEYHDPIIDDLRMPLEDSPERTWLSFDLIIA